MGVIVPDAIEGYLANLNRGTDDLLKDIARGGAERKLPLVDAEVGALLRVLAIAVGARKILEIGTAIGYSGIWLAGALPADGMLMTMEMDPERGREAQENFARAGLASRVSVILGDAQRMVAVRDRRPDFPGRRQEAYVPLLDRLVSLLRPGGLLVTDNVLWDGKVVPGFAEGSAKVVAQGSSKDVAERSAMASAERGADDENTRAIVEYNEKVAAHPALLTAIVPLRDGVSISVKRA
jgi:predicted O-methyltransferase YrrM